VLVDRLEKPFKLLGESLKVVGDEKVQNLVSSSVTFMSQFSDLNNVMNILGEIGKLHPVIGGAC
jgi:hypothetical protein